MVGLLRQHDRPEVIGARLKALRKAMGYDQTRAFSLALGISEQAWSNCESGRRRISLDEAMKVIARTGVSLD